MYIVLKSPWSYHFKNFLYHQDRDVTLKNKESCDKKLGLIDTKVAAANEEISSIEKSIASLREEIVKLSEQIRHQFELSSTKNNSKNTMKIESKQVQSQNLKLNDDIKSMSVNLKDIQSKIDDLEQQLKNENQEAACKREIELQSLKKSLGALQSQIDTQTNEQKNLK